MLRAALTFAPIFALLLASACGASAPKTPVGPPPEYEDARPPVPATSSATPSASPAGSTTP